MEHFGNTPDGKEVSIFTLKNQSGVEARITNFGGRIVSLKVPDRKKHFDDVVLGFDNLEGYTTKNPYFGALVGRYANRIAKGTFKLDGKTYHLPINDGPNSLHGGTKGFDSRIWTARDVSDVHGPALELAYNSIDGEEGYPGALTTIVKYTLTEKDELRIDYAATTKSDTVLNLSNHSYFNLAGQGKGDILKHRVTIYAEEFTPIDATLIPTGKLQSVAGSPFDFRKATAIGERINNNNEQLKLGKGYDHNFALSLTTNGIGLAARIEEPNSGRILEVFTTQPGLQFYSGNFLDGTLKGKGGHVYQKREGLCLETQHFPDSPNQPGFPSTVLKQGQKFHQTTIFRFSTE